MVWTLHVPNRLQGGAHGWELDEGVAAGHQHEGVACTVIVSRQEIFSLLERAVHMVE